MLRRFRACRNSVDDNLVVISNNFSTLNSQVSTLNSNVVKNTSDISALQTRIAALEEKSASLDQNLSQLTDLVGEMGKTEKMLTDYYTDHETRIAALEARMLAGTSGTSASSTASGTFDLSPGLKKFDTALVAALDADGKNIFTLNGALNAKVLGAESLKLGSQTSGSAKIDAGETANDSSVHRSESGFENIYHPDRIDRRKNSLCEKRRYC